MHSYGIFPCIKTHIKETTEVIAHTQINIKMYSEKMPSLPAARFGGSF